MFQPLFDMYLGYFQAHGEAALTRFCNCTVPSEVILSFYPKCAPIEDLPQKEKEELWAYAKETYPNGDKDLWLKFSKIVHVIGNSI